MPAPPSVTIHCRWELPRDVAAIRKAETMAFGRAHEAALVDALRDAGALSLSAVAEVHAEIVGHIAFSPVSIDGATSNCSALALAPMAVLPDWQRKGVGSALLRWSLDECRHGGHQLVIVLGHPDYYPRFGFVPAIPLGILCPFEVPSEVFMLLELQPGTVHGCAGTVRYRPEFADV